MSFDFSTIKIEEAKKQWEDINDKLSRLEKQRVQETRAEEIFRLDQLIKTEKEARQRVEQDIMELQEGGSTAVSQNTPEQQESSFSSGGKTKILFLAANPVNTSRLRLDEEVRKITMNLERAKERDKLVFIQRWAVTPSDVMDAIMNESPQIVHFSGHAEQEGLCLEDNQGNAKIVNAKALAALFDYCKDSVQGVLLNACYSAAQAEAIKEYIPHVIGMSSAIPDSVAISFTDGFYKAIGVGKDIPSAFQAGKIAVLMQGDGGDELLRLL